jgi:hypothetical protein
MLHRLAIRICPAALNSLSTAALLGKAALYLQKAAANWGKVAKDVVSSDFLCIEYAYIGWYPWLVHVHYS